MFSKQPHVIANWYVGVSIAALTSIVAAVPAAAQTVKTPAGTAAAAAASSTEGSSDDAIVVTGSRLVTNGNSSPTPVTVASTAELLLAQPAGVIEGLNALPGLLGSINTTSNVNTGGFNTLNLRGIGTTRGLILMDGHRIGPTQGGGAVDVDVIPQILLRRVDVVTGGASAAYGSDAVSGVVNFVTDRSFEGIKAEARSGLSKYNDDGKVGLGLAFGTKFADGRGHFEAGYEFSQASGFLRSGRPFLDNYASMVGSGTAASPYQLIYGAKLNAYSFGGLVNTGALAGLQFAQNGTLSAFNPGTVTSTAAVSLGGDGAYFMGSTAGSALRNHRGLVRLDYDLTNDIKFHAEGVFSKFKQSYTQQNPLLTRLLIGYNNAYLSTVQPQYQSTIAAQAATGGSFAFSKLDLNLPNYQFDAKETYVMADAGFEGKLGGFDWELDYYHTDSDETVRNNHNIDNQKLWAALNAVNVNGAIVCNAAVVNPSVYGGCVPLNVFGPSSDQARAINYITKSSFSRPRYITNDVNATIKGTVLNLPAGPVGVALIGEYRKLTYSNESNATPVDPISCTGIQFNCTNTVNTVRYLGGQSAVRTPVSQTVKEVAVEADVPLLRDVAFFRALTLNAAGRYTNYDTSGDAWTWKGGLVWNVSDALTLRATRSRDIRAPNLSDLFSPQAITTTNYTDLHTNTSGIVTQVAQGNPGLKPEKADTFTAGVVLKPGFFRGFSLAVDYYRININQALVNIQAFQPATQQACEDSGGTGSVCALFARPLPFADRTVANFPTLLYSQTLNVASLRTYGVDVEANYNGELFNRPLRVRELVTYQPQLRYDNGPSGVVDVGGAADGVGGLPPIAKVKIVASIDYELVDHLSVLLRERWRSALRQHGTRSLVFAIGDIPAVGYTDANINFDVSKRFSLYLNVQNLFNTNPPVFASTGGSTQMNYLGGFAQGDDIEGRYYTVGVRLRL